MTPFSNLLAALALAAPFTVLAGDTVSLRSSAAKLAAPQLAPGTGTLADATALPRSNRSDALPPATVPGSSNLQYRVEGRIKGIPYGARSTLNWSNLGTSYSARMEVRVPLLGSRVQTSTGALNAQGLLPARFVDRSRHERTADFDRSLGKIRFSNQAPPAALQQGAQDRLSVFLQLAALLNARPEAFKPGQVIPLQVAGTGGAEVWPFEVGEKAMLDLPAGPIEARHLVRPPRSGHEKDSQVDIWLAPSLSHLPVRIRISEPEGDSVDQRLSQMPG